MFSHKIPTPRTAAAVKYIYINDKTYKLKRPHVLWVSIKRTQLAEHTQNEALCILAIISKTMHMHCAWRVLFIDTLALHFDSMNRSVLLLLHLTQSHLISLRLADTANIKRTKQKG